MRPPTVIGRLGDLESFSTSGNSNLAEQPVGLPQLPDDGSGV
jgi:hypothetical protein